MQPPTSEVVHGKQADTVILSFSPDSITNGTDIAGVREMTKTKFIIDPDSSMVSSMKYPNAAENDPGFIQQMEVLYSDYRNVNGVAVPFKQVTNADGALQSEITIESVSFGVGLLDSEFEFVKEVADAK